MNLLEETTMIYPDSAKLDKLFYYIIQIYIHHYIFINLFYRLIYLHVNVSIYAN